MGCCNGTAQGSHKFEEVLYNEHISGSYVNKDQIKMTEKEFLKTITEAGNENEEIDEEDELFVQNAKS